MNGDDILNSPGILAALHGIIVLWGIVECFFGWKLVRFLIVLAGIFIGSAIGAYVGGMFPPEQLIYSIPGGILIGAIVIGLIAFRLFQVAIFLLGGLVGATIASTFIQQTGEPAYTIILVISGIVAGAVTVVLMRPMVIISMATSGAIKMVVGGAFFAGILSFEPWNEHPGQIAGEVAASLPLLAGWAGLSIVGALFQFWTTRKREEGGK